jgi:ABC-type multidrug transport system ATPase subunit
MIDKFMARNRKVDPTSMLAKQKKEYAEWQEKHRAHRVMLAGTSCSMCMCMYECIYVHRNSVLCLYLILSLSLSHTHTRTGKFTFKPPPFLKGVPEGTAPEDVSLINMDKLTFSYNPETSPFIFENPISFNCNLGTRVGVMGPNGAGKSTFLKLLTSKLKPTTGEITSHPDYRLAYFGQHSTKELDMEHTPKEFMCKSFPEEKAGVLVGHLSKTSINSDAANTRMKNLSYSQRSCVIFAKLTYHPPHVLIMDEPTNFLDLDSVDSLIAATNKFKGALLVVTHSRDFLKRCATTFLSIVPGRFLTFKSMKEAESSTYSFIAAMEDGERINTKNLIVDNPSAGINDMTKKEKKKAEDQTDADGNLVMSSINLDGSKKKKGGMTAAQRKREEEAEAKKVKDEKKAKKAKARAARKTDWKVGDTPFAMVGKGKNAGYQQATVTKVTGMGVIISVNGKNVMVDANKLFEVNPSPAGKASGGASRGGRGGGRGGRVTGGSSTARGPAAKQDQGRQSGARGGRGGARGGRGGRGGRGQGNQTQRTSTNNQTGGGNRNARRQGNQQQPRGKVRSGSERN